MSKKLLILLLSLMLVLSVFTACASENGDEETSSTGGDAYVNIATGGTGGAYYPLGGAMANIFNDNVENVTANAQSTGASVENINIVSSGEAEVAFVQNDVTYYAWNGIESFEDSDEVTNIRGMAMLYPEVVQIIATESSGIESVEDLVGKDVAVGASGSGTEVNARQILAEYGITYEDLGKADYLSFNEAADQLKNNQIDAAFVTAATPTAAVTEVTQTADIVVIPVDPSVISSLNEQYPFYTEFTIPGGTYKNQDSDVVTPAVMAMLVVPEGLDEDLTYELTKALFENQQVIADTHDRGNDIQLESALEGMPIDVHPGAQRYYDEMEVGQ